MEFFTPTLHFMLGQNQNKGKEKYVNLALIVEDEELNDMEGFDSASFLL